MRFGRLVKLCVAPGDKYPAKTEGQRYDEDADGNQLVEITTQQDKVNEQNPKTLERVPVPARRTVKFKPGKIMKEAVDFPSAPDAELPVVETMAPVSAVASV